MTKFDDSSNMASVLFIGGLLRLGFPLEQTRIRFLFAIQQPRLGPLRLTRHVARSFPGLVQLPGCSLHWYKCSFLAHACENGLWKFEQRRRRFSAGLDSRTKGSSHEKAMAPLRNPSQAFLAGVCQERAHVPVQAVPRQLD